MELFAVEGIPEIRPDDNIGELIAERVSLRDDDVVVVASTIVSKAEDRRASLEAYDPGPRAREIANRIGAISGEEKDPRLAQAVLEESTEVLIETPFLLSETHCGHVGVNAGIDRSNTGDAEILLLPRRPSASAAVIRQSLPDRNPVIVTDTCGRPFRHGQVGVALGWDGMGASRDWRGMEDRDGHELAVTVESIVDELAAAANVVSGEGADGTPVIVARDVPLAGFETSDALFRDVRTDFVRQALRDWDYPREPPVE